MRCRSERDEIARSRRRTAGNLTGSRSGAEEAARVFDAGCQIVEVSCPPLRADGCRPIRDASCSDAERNELGVAPNQNNGRMLPREVQPSVDTPIEVPA